MPIWRLRRKQIEFNSEYIFYINILATILMENDSSFLKI